MYYSQFNGPLSNDTITVGYDQVGRPINIQIGSAQASVQYDTLNRIVWSSNLLGVTSIEYTGATKRPAIISQPNGLTTTFEYSPVADGSRLQTMVTTNSSGQEISQFHYAYNINDLIIALTNISDGITTSWQYKYDLAKQLTEAHQWTNGILAHHYVYSYDKAGNRLSEQIDLAAATESPNELNQILDLSGGGQVKVAGFISETGSVSIAGSPAQMLNTTNFTGIITAQPGTNTFNVIATDPSGNTTTNWYNLTISANGLATAFSYDKAGNQLVKSNANQIFTFGWDGADRCTTITNGNFQTTLAYDGLSRWSRITEYSNSTLIADRRFIYIGTALAEERDATGTNIIKRFFANGFWQQGTNYYYNTDHLGSILEVTTQNGTIIAKFQYDPYGRRTQTFGTLWVDFGYAGLFELPNGLKLAVWRIYDPSTGRWINRDPIREQGGWNLYAYCAGNPVCFLDVQGLQSWLGAGYGAMGWRAGTPSGEVQAIISDPATGLFNYLDRSRKPATIGEPLMYALQTLQANKTWPQTATQRNLAIKDYGAWNCPYSTFIVWGSMGQFRYTRVGNQINVFDNYDFPATQSDWHGGVSHHNIGMAWLQYVGAPYTVSGSWTVNNIPTTIKH